jgi:hypothetical protein
MRALPNAKHKSHAKVELIVNRVIHFRLIKPPSPVVGEEKGGQQKSRGPIKDSGFSVFTYVSG